MSPARDYGPLAVDFFCGKRPLANEMISKSTVIIMTEMIIITVPTSWIGRIVSLKKMNPRIIAHTGCRKEAAPTLTALCLEMIVKKRTEGRAVLKIPNNTTDSIDLLLQVGDQLSPNARLRASATRAAIIS